jgi:hypothetical protein
MWIAPKARRRLRDPARFAAETLVWIAAAGALADRGGPRWAVAFGALALITAVGARRFEPPASTRQT